MKKQYMVIRHDTNFSRYFDDKTKAEQCLVLWANNDIIGSVYDTYTADPEINYHGEMVAYSNWTHGGRIVILLKV